MVSRCRDPILVVSPAKTYKSQRKRANIIRWEVSAISEISINWDIRVKQKLSALAALWAAGSKWRQYWFCITPVKRYTFFHNDQTIVLCISIKNTRYRGVEQLVARRAHNPEVARSNRASATNEDLPRFIVRSVKTLKHSGWACHARQTKSRIALWL